MPCHGSLRGNTQGMVTLLSGLNTCLIEDSIERKIALLCYRSASVSAEQAWGSLYIELMTTVSKQSMQQLCDFVHLQHSNVLIWQVNDYQIRLRCMTRRMMATVSELSMYQAHSIKLSADKEALAEVVTAASDKLEVWEELVRLCSAQCSRLFKSDISTTMCMEVQQQPYHCMAAFLPTGKRLLPKSQHLNKHRSCSLKVFCGACLMLKSTLCLGGFMCVTAGCSIIT